LCISRRPCRTLIVMLCIKLGTDQLQAVVEDATGSLQRTCAIVRYLAHLQGVLQALL
jgi:hypothetical protein